MTYSYSTIREFSSKKNILMLLDYYCLFGELLKHIFNVGYSKFMVLAMKNLLMEIIKYDNIRNIKKIGVLLNGDLWEKTDLDESLNMFTFEKIEERTPFYLKNFLTVINDVKSIVNKDNIENIFNRVFLSPVSINRKNSINNSIHFKLDGIDNDYKTLPLLAKPLNFKELIVTSSFIGMLRGLIDLLIDILFFDSLTYEIFFQIFTLFDYFIYASINMFIIERNYLNGLISTIHFEDKTKIEYYSDITSYQQKYGYLRYFLINAKEKIEEIFKKEKLNSEIYLPKLTKNFFDNRNKYTKSNYVKIMLWVNTLKSLYKIVKRYSHYTKKIDLDFQRDFIIEEIEKYKKIIYEIQYFFYMKIASEIIEMKPIREMILIYNWTPPKEEAETLLFESSTYVNKTLAQLKTVYDNIKSKLNNFPQKIQNSLIIAFIKFIIGNIQDSYSNIKKCNTTGRSIMLKDLKFLKQGFEDTINKNWGYKINISEYFDIIFNYVNSWYYDKNELEKFIFDNVSYIF